MLACFGINCGPNGFEEPATRSVSPQETIVELRNHIERLEKRDRYLDIKMDEMAKEAKRKLASGDKKGAVNLMKKRKLYAAEQAKINNVKMTLETQCIHLESATSTADAFQAMKAGSNTMQKIHQQVGINQVDELMMDIQEEMQMAEEVNSAIGQTLDPTLGAVDDDDLMKELEELDAIELENKLNQAESGKFSLPDVPSVIPHGLSKKEEDDLSKLQAELAMA